MLELGNQLDLALKALAGGGACERPVKQDLYGDLAFGRLLNGLIDNALPAAMNLPKDFVSGNGGADRTGRRARSIRDHRFGDVGRFRIVRVHSVCMRNSSFGLAQVLQRCKKVGSKVWMSGQYFRIRDRLAFYAARNDIRDDRLDLIIPGVRFSGIFFC